MESSSEFIPINSQKHDPAWEHCQMLKDGDRVRLKCIYCNKVFSGGGIHRIKEHLAGQKGNAAICLKVRQDVRCLMQESLDGGVAKRRKKTKIPEQNGNFNLGPNGIATFATQNEADPGVQFQTFEDTLEPNSNFLSDGEEEMTKYSLDRRKTGKMKDSFPPPATPDVSPISQAALGSSKLNNQVHMAIGRFLYDVGAPLDAVNSAYFRPMIEAIASQGPGLITPSYHDLRGWVLKNSVEEVKTILEQYKGTWERTGCSLLADEWITETGRTMINFLVYCPEGTLFLKCVDVSDAIRSAEMLYELLKDVVEEVGLKYVLQVITDCAEHYVVAGKRLTDTFPTMYWTPCAARCIDLILEDFGKLEWIKAILENAKSITRFIYNHSMVLNMMRKYTYGNDLVEPGITRSATNFITLQHMVNLRDNLQAMVSSQEWMDCPYSKKPDGLDMTNLICGQSFWSSCILIIHLTDPLLRVMRMANSEKMPAMGHIFAGMYRVKEAIKKELVNKKDYIIYWDIIDERWNRRLHSPLHAAGFYLNPRFFYIIEGDVHNEIWSGMLDCIERLVPDTAIQDMIIKEMSSYKNAIGDFGRKMAVRARESMPPAEWWFLYGGGCPKLAHLAIRILSQTCSAIGWKRNHIPFGQIQNTRNFLEHQRISDLVFLQYNLRLQKMLQKNKEMSPPDPIDPISFEIISSVDEWVAEKEVLSEDYGDSNWMILDQPVANTMLLISPNEEAECLDTGFEDYEIYNGIQDDEDKKVMVTENA